SSFAGRERITSICGSRYARRSSARACAPARSTIVHRARSASPIDSSAIVAMARMAASTWRSSRCASAIAAVVLGACGGGTKTRAAAKHSPRPGWGARVALAIDVHAERPLADFPVPIRITPDRFDLKRIAADGHDLRFTDSAGVDLPFEVESLTASHG